MGHGLVKTIALLKQICRRNEIPTCFLTFNIEIILLTEKVFGSLQNIPFMVQAGAGAEVVGRRTVELISSAVVRSVIGSSVVIIGSVSGPRGVVWELI